MVQITGTSGNDSLKGTNFDNIVAGPGDDIIQVTLVSVGSPAVTIDGGSGTDALIYDLGGEYSLDQTTFVGIESLELKDFRSDGGPASVFLTVDQIRGVGGAIKTDVAQVVHLTIGGNGAVDLSHSAQGFDILAYPTVTSVTGTPFADVISALNGASVFGGAGDDVITAAGPVDGGAGDDVITVSAPGAILAADGGSGFDKLDLSLEVSSTTVVASALDISKGASLLPGGGYAKNFELLTHLEVVGNNNVLTAGASAAALTSYGDGNVINAGPATASAIGEASNILAISTIHVVPGMANEQIVATIVDLDYRSASGGVHVLSELYKSTANGDTTDHQLAYIGASFSSSTSSVVALAGQTLKVEGSAFADVLAGDGGRGVFGPQAIYDGGAGDDLIIAGLSDSTLIGGAGNDTVSFDIQVYSGGDAPDGSSRIGQDAVTPVAITGVTVDLASSGQQNAGPLSVTLSGFENLTGSSSADALFGDGDSNTITGLAGADAINGRAGDDTLNGGAGDDTLTGSAGSDRIDGGDGTDTAVFSGPRARYAIAVTSGSGSVTDSQADAGGDGTDTLTSIEGLSFSDVLVTNGVNVPQAYASAVSSVFRVSAASSISANFDKLIAPMSSAQAIGTIVGAAISTTSVATIAYEFFTGHTPGAAGIDYLVSPIGPNPNNLNSAYYQSFNLENRYINFAVNLGKLGEGKAAFQTAYRSLSFYDAFKKAYGVIFGATPSDAHIHAILDPTLTLNGHAITRQQYFATYGGDEVDGIGTKAAAVGWLMSEAEKADLGTYAKSNDAFLTAVANGQASFGVDLIGVYAKPEYAYHA